jgi:hypothetical protein
MKPFNPKPRPCTHCDKPFVPARPMQAVCSPICAARKVRADKAQERAKIVTRKEAIKTIPQLIREAQHAFNAYIRARDSSMPCICCGQALTQEAVGGGYDCGHYRSTGSASHLRFNEDNAHGQRKVCNRYGAGRAVDYRIGLIARIGLARVEALESNNKVAKWTADGLRSIKTEYRAKLKALQNLNLENTNAEAAN